MRNAGGMRVPPALHGKGYLPFFLDSLTVVLG